MPCDSLQTSTVDIGKLDPALAALAIAELSKDNPAFINASYANGTLTIAGYRLDKQYAARQVKRAYSAEVVKSTAKRYGWTLKETAKYQYEVIRR